MSWKVRIDNAVNHKAKEAITSVDCELSPKFAAPLGGDVQEEYQVIREALTKLCENVAGGEVISITAEGHVDVAGNNSGSIKWTIVKAVVEELKPAAEPPAQTAQPVVTTDEQQQQEASAVSPETPVNLDGNINEAEPPAQTAQ